MSAPRPCRIWIEVGDLLQYFREHSTPAGISRIQFEVIPRLLELFPDRISLFQIGRSSSEIEVLTFDEILRRCDNAALLARFGRHRTLFNVLQFVSNHARSALSALKLQLNKAGRDRFADQIRLGDVILNLGGSWSHQHFGRSVGELKRDFGVRFAVLIHDVLPLTHRKLVAARFAPFFDRWFDDMTRVWDLVLTPSHSTARALREQLDLRGQTAPPIRRIRFGSGFCVPQHSLHEDARTHVLYVSTIEVRKNHRLLFEIWQQMMSDYGAERVPELVFAGKFGWQIDDLKRDLQATRFLDGKIRVVENLDDAELAALYRGSYFTVYPSFCEGWGLPVGESLHFGRYCIASDATSLPEVGAGFVDHHAPADIKAARRLIEAALFSPGHLDAKEAAIRESYVPRSWRETAGEIVAVISDTFDDAELSPQRRGLE